MTLEEAIQHAVKQSASCADGKCSEEHAQLAEWLKELKYLREIYWEEESANTYLTDLEKKFLRLASILSQSSIESK